MKIVIVIAMIVCGCGDNVQVPVSTGKYVQEMCGPMPQTPGYVVYFEKDRAILFRDNFITMADSLQKLSDWSFCVSQLE